MNTDFFDSVDIKPFISSFFNNSTDLYAFAKDNQFRFTMVNNTLLKRLGLISESEILGKTDFDIFQANIAALFKIEDQEVLDTRKPILNRTWSVPNGKGSLDWYISSKYPLFKENGHILGYFGVMRGITKAGSILEPYAQMTDVINYIQANFSKQIEISILAKMVNLSVSQFERKFKKLFAMTPLKFINKVRIDKACEMLTSSYATLSAIALDCGFYDHSYFTKIFKKQISVTPTAYRKEFLK